MNKLTQVFKTFLIFSVLALTSCAEQESKNVKPPEGVISVKEAKLLDKTFTETRHNLISNSLGIQDNRSSWWSIEDIENYIAYAKSKASEEGLKVNGLRIYFAAYPKDFKNQEVAGRSTLFIVPTGAKSIQESSLSILNTSFDENDDLDIPPLNMGHAGNPPHRGY